MVCNHFSKAMELEARKGDARTEEDPRHDTRGSRAQLEQLQNDPTLVVPVIKVRGESIEVVSHFRYLGAEDKDDGSLGVEIQARICRMKQRFKEFEGRVLCNNRVSTLPRLQVQVCSHDKRDIRMRGVELYQGGDRPAGKALLSATAGHDAHAQIWHNVSPGPRTGEGRGGGKDLSN